MMKTTKTKTPHVIAGILTASEVKEVQREARYSLLSLVLICAVIYIIQSVLPGCWALT
jgi:hypothetical protein